VSAGSRDAAIVWQLDRRAGAPLGEAIELTSQSELVLRTLGEHMFKRVRPQPGAAT
jgi:hypothetical protein